MRNKVIFIASGVGLLLALVSAFIFSQQPKAQPPVFKPAANPYAQGIYAERHHRERPGAGREHQHLSRGVRARSRRSWSPRAQQVHKGDALLTIDDSVQRATAEQQRAQAEAAQATAAGAQGGAARARISRCRVAQVENARATLKNAQDQLAKQQRSYDIDAEVDQRGRARQRAERRERSPRRTSRSIERQYELTKAGAWIYDIQNQERHVRRRSRRPTAPPRRCSRKYTIRAPGGRRRAGDAGRASAATCPRRAPTTPTRRASVRSSSWARRRATCRCAPTSMRSWCTSCPIRRRSRPRCSFAAPMITCR